jgi:3-dehydro-L-gulonate 2-dehydrogenase
MPREKIILIPYQELKSQLQLILEKYGYSRMKADKLAEIFSQSSLDGVYSHGINRFRRFIETVKMGYVQKDRDPVRIYSFGAMEQWDGHGGSGILNALTMMDRAIELAGRSGIGCVGLRNTNHWMRGGTYGWQAVEKGMIGICFTNTKPNMVPWGGSEIRIGNNPLIIAIPRKQDHIVLDMAISQYSFGKIQEYALKRQQLPFPGGMDDRGDLTRDPDVILKTEKTIPIGYWKGSGLSFVLDLLAALISGGDTSSVIAGREEEYGLSQVFIAIQPGFLPEREREKMIDEAIQYLKDIPGIREGSETYYPGEKTVRTRVSNLKEGIPVNAGVWEEIKNL